MFNPFKFLNIPVFVAALALGVFAVYVSDDQMRKIVVYPTPDNVDLVQYRDAAGSCFTYEQQDVKCPADMKNVFRIPVQ